MSDRQPLTISVENLGPIRSAEIELKPLTILIGLNNTGKSKFAELLYALFKASRSQAYSRIFRLPSGMPEQPNAQLYQLLAATVRDRAEVDLRDLPNNFCTDVIEQYNEMSRETLIELDARIRDCLGYEKLGDAVRVGTTHRTGTVKINDTLLQSQIGEDSSASFGLSGPQPEVIRFLRGELDEYGRSAESPSKVHWTRLLANRLWVRALEDRGIPIAGLYYLPSYRSGLVHNFDFFTSWRLEHK